MTKHAIFNRPLDAPIPHGFDQALFGMGRYRAAEPLFWQQHGVWLTQAGFAGGHLENPTPQQVAAGDSGHAEMVRIVFDSSQISYERLLKLFWENHDPTRDADQASPHRSLIMTFNDSQQAMAEASRVAYGNRLAINGFSAIATQIVPASRFWPAPPDEQQFLARHPGSDCTTEGTGIEAPMPKPDPL